MYLKMISQQKKKYTSISLIIIHTNSIQLKSTPKSKSLSRNMVTRITGTHYYTIHYRTPLPLIPQKQ